MKYLKKFENYELTGYEGKLFINTPSAYFKSDMKFQIIFVDTITGLQNEIYYNHCEIKGQDVIQLNRYDNDKETFLYMNSWDQLYSDDEFKRIKFMTAEEFYDEYESSYLKIFNDLLCEIDKLTQIGSRRYIKLNRLLERLTIPEVEYIINTRKFNI